ncbi:mitotic apparatus protein p62-like isoform X1 [Senna tora]|uniref:Mitotic apparatus protein p62-like isoform X1 n=1 Tax=Senna tora TaxID=362788 RepID=A0A834WST4_9FABA|nr:mitotic apparatus protein p62-like isoform X1 [Senna tora]
MDSVKNEEEESGTRSVGVHGGYEYDESDFYPDLPYVGDYKSQYKYPGSSLTGNDADFMIDDDLVEKLYPTGTHPITVSEYRKYTDQVHKSGGFDVDPIPKCDQTSLIAPLSEWQLAIYEEYFMSLASQAIARYNAGKRKNFKAVRIVKANMQPVCVCNYFITFEATDGVSTKTFQTKIWAGVKDHKIEIIREKPWVTLIWGSVSNEYGDALPLCFRKKGAMVMHRPCTKF